MKTLQTSNGHAVLVDDDDLEVISQWSWVAIKKHNIIYAARNTYISGGRKNRKTRRIYMHHQIAGATERGICIDHLNGNGLDNRKNNLRRATASENQRNRSGAQSNSRSGVRGVYWHSQRGKWAATIRHNRKNISLGLYSDIDEAIAARAAGEAKLWQEKDRYRTMIQAAEGKG